MNPDRRPLQFQSLDEIMPEVERLMAGNTAVGSWTLGQVCEHLATVKKRLIDAPAEPKPDPSLRVGDDRKREVFETGLIPEGMTMPGGIAAPGAVPAEEGAEHLRAAIAYYQASPTGPVTDHRLFGPLSKDEWNKIMLIHSAHHLSFILPKAG